jgi:hypothetical protein
MYNHACQLHVQGTCMYVSVMLCEERRKDNIITVVNRIQRMIQFNIRN